MAAKPTTRVQRSPPRAAKRSSVLDKHGGALKMFANYGFAGLAFGYLLIVTIPDGQKAFQAALDKQAEQSREDRKDALAHGERAVERIATSIDGVKGAFGTVQSVTQGNQRALLDEQKKTNQLLETRMGQPPPLEFNPTLK